MYGDLYLRSSLNSDDIITKPHFDDSIFGHFYSIGIIRVDWKLF